MSTTFLPSRTTVVVPPNPLHAVAVQTTLRHLLRPDPVPPAQPPIKRYVYDLSALCRELALLLGREPTDSISRAWVVEHLRSYHNLEVEDLTDYVARSDIREVDERCPEWARINTSTLYQLFSPMAFAAVEALTTEMAFANDILTVTLRHCPERHFST